MPNYYETRSYREAEQAKKERLKNGFKQVSHIALKTLVYLGAISLIPAGCYGILKASKYLDEDGDGNVETVAVKVIEGRTNLHHAAVSNDPQLVTDSLNKGEDINAKDENGDTPLMLAAQTGHTELCGILIDAGANINLQNNAGSTALHQAIGENRTKTVKFLIENGADLNIKNNFGVTPLDYSPQGVNSEISLLLRQADEKQKADKDSTEIIEKKNINIEKFVEVNQRN